MYTITAYFCNLKEEVFIIVSKRTFMMVPRTDKLTTIQEMDSRTTTTHTSLNINISLATTLTQYTRATTTCHQATAHQVKNTIHRATILKAKNTRHQATTLQATPEATIHQAPPLLRASTTKR
jgi:hypothetical protein